MEAEFADHMFRVVASPSTSPLRYPHLLHVPFILREASIYDGASYHRLLQAPPSLAGVELIEETKSRGICRYRRICLQESEAAPKSKLKKPLKPEWASEKPSMAPLMTPNAQKCIEKWGLLPPYDIMITEEQWAQYFEERCALEKRNTPGTEEYKKIKSEELMQNLDQLRSDAS